MVYLIAACSKDPGAMTEWFPRHHLKRAFRKNEAADEALVEERVAPERCFAGAVMRAYREPVLSGGVDSETYRVTWLPSFHPPVVVRLESRGASATATIKKGRVEGEELSADFDAVTREVPIERFEAARALAERSGCWSEGHECHGELSASTALCDGEAWLLEGARGNEHWAVELDNPGDGPFVEVVRALIAAAGAEKETTFPR
jgi:hypothetical protein